MKICCSLVLLPFLFFGQPLFGQTPEIGIRGQVTQQGPGPISVEQADALLESVPPAVRAIRGRQLVAARSQDVDLIFHDDGVISETAIRGVPLDLRGIPIQGDDQIAAFVELLYPLFGFENNEQLILSGSSGNGYSFNQTINGMLVEPKVIHVVLGPDRTISAIRGSAILNRGFRVDHPLDAEGAMELVDRHLEEKGLSSRSKNLDEDRVYLVYKRWDDGRSLAPWWYVEKAGHPGYYVDPNGTVTSAVVVTP